MVYVPGLVGSGTFRRRESSIPGHFGTWSFQSWDILVQVRTALGHFGPLTFRPWDILLPERFCHWAFLSRDNWVPGHFGIVTFQSLGVSATGHFALGRSSPGTCQSLDISVPGHFGNRSFWPRDISIP